MMERPSSLSQIPLFLLPEVFIRVVVRRLVDLDDVVGPAAREVEQHHVAAVALNEGPEVGAAPSANDEVALPVPDDQALLDLRRSSVQRQHVRDAPRSDEDPAL